MRSMRAHWSIHVLWSSLDFRLNIFAAWERDPFMCPLPGPAHQSLTRNMPLPGARSHLSPYHGIRAILPLLMEGGKQSGYFSSISQTIYSISSHWRSSSAGVHVVVINCVRPVLPDDLTDLKLTREGNLELFKSSRLRSVSSQEGKVKPIHFIFPLVLQSRANIKTRIPAMLQGVMLQLLHQVSYHEP